LGLQLDTLEAEGIVSVTVVTGFNSHLVEAEIALRHGDMPVTCIFNPFYQVADNLASCWMARKAMTEDFLLLNGDTLFERALLRTILDSYAQPIMVTIDKKQAYDSDDMKVTLDGTSLLSIGKTLSKSETHGESIGILRFMAEGRAQFTDMLDTLLRTPDGTNAWFLTALDRLAKQGTPVKTLNIAGHNWQEIDTPEDYEKAWVKFDQPLLTVVSKA
jgi:choline kinase